MGCIVRVHHPDLTPEERERRIEAIKQAIIEFHREVQRNEAQKISNNN